MVAFRLERLTVRAMNVLITGANRGIGLALTRGWLERGASVYATTRDPASATELRALADDARLRIFGLDVTNDAQCKELATWLGDAKLDVLINNAGISGNGGKLGELDFADTLRVIDTNALGALRVTRAVLPSIVKGATIVNITSLMGSIDDNGSGGAYAYRMSKAALNMAGKNLAHELGGKKVVVLSVHPGWVQTSMGGQSAPLTPDDSANGIIALTERATTENTGHFYNYDGRELPW